MASQKVLCFVDTGGDDAFFLVYVLNHPEIFDVLGIISQAGNTNLANAYRNTPTHYCFGW